MSTVTATSKVVWSPTLPLPAAQSPQPRRSQQVLSKEAVIERLFEAFSHRRLDEALHLLTEDVVFTPMTARLTRSGEPYRGHDGMRRYIADVEATWEELTLRPTQIKAAGNAVVALGLVSGRGPNGAFEDAPTTWTFKFRGDLVAQAQIFSDSTPVSQAAGERESA